MINNIKFKLKEAFLPLKRWVRGIKYRFNDKIWALKYKLGRKLYLKSRKLGYLDLNLLRGIPPKENFYDKVDRVTIQLSVPNSEISASFFNEELANIVEEGTKRNMLNQACDVLKDRIHSKDGLYESKIYRLVFYVPKEKEDD